MKRAVCNLTLLLLLICQPALALQITFQKGATIDMPKITLGDVATFDEDTDISRALGSLIVAPSPQPGEHKMLSPVEIRNTLLRSRRIPAGTTWRASGLISVQRSGVEVRAEQMLTAIRDYLTENSANLPEAEITFTPTSLPAPFMVPEGKLNCEVIPSSPRILGSSRFSLIFRIKGTVVCNMSIPGKITAMADVVVTKRAVRRGQSLSPTVIGVARMDIARIPDAVTSLNMASGKRLTRSLRAETILRQTMLEEIPVILRGEQVKIILRSENMVLSATGVALMDGIRGGSIQVQNSSSGKRLRARVEGPGLVAIEN